MSKLISCTDFPGHYTQLPSPVGPKLVSHTSRSPFSHGQSKLKPSRLRKALASIITSWQIYLQHPNERASIAPSVFASCSPQEQHQFAFQQTHRPDHTCMKQSWQQITPMTILSGPCIADFGPMRASSQHAAKPCLSYVLAILWSSQIQCKGRHRG